MEFVQNAEINQGHICVYDGEKQSGACQVRSLDKPGTCLCVIVKDTQESVSEIFR